MVTDGSSRIIILLRCWYLCLVLAGLCMLLLGWEHVQIAAFDTGFDLCRLTVGVGCREAVQHPFARFGFLPVPFWVLALYSLLLQAGPAGWDKLFRRRLAVFGVLVLCLGSLLFIVVMVRDFISLCPLCVATHILHFCLALLTGLLLKLQPANRLPVAMALPKNAVIIVPLLVIIVGYCLSSWAASRQEEARLRAVLTGASMTSAILQSSIDRFYLAGPEQLIVGNPRAKLRLTIVGSLTCSHCRKLISAAYILPARLLEQIGVEFVSYPVAAACNSKIGGPASERHPEQCRLAEQALQAQRQGRFKEFFSIVNSSPALTLRRLGRSSAQEESWDAGLIGQIRLANEIPVTAIPFLLWDGQKLPPELTALSLENLLDYLLAVRQRAVETGKEFEECGTC